MDFPPAPYVPDNAFLWSVFVYRLVQNNLNILMVLHWMARGMFLWQIVIIITDRIQKKDSSLHKLSFRRIQVLFPLWQHIQP